MEPRIADELNTLILELNNINGEPTNLTDLLQMCMTNIIFSVTLGKSFNYKNRDFQDVVKAAETQVRLSPDAASGLLVAFPLLRYMPGDVFNAKRILGIAEDIYAFFNKTIEKGERITDNYVDAYLQERRDQQHKGRISTFTGEE